MAYYTTPAHKKGVPRVVQTREEMRHIQRSLILDPQYEDTRKQDNKIIKQYVELSLAEEGFYKQKSRINQLGQGDNNTAYLHKCVNGNKDRSRISSIQCKGRNW